MGLLARKADGVPLDAEGAEHHPERQVHPLQDGTLLDVQLEVGDGVLELPRLVDPVEVHAMLPSASGRATPSLSFRLRTSSGSSAPAAAPEPKRLRPKRAPSSSAQSTRRNVTGRSCGARARMTSRAPTTFRAPSSQPPFGTESMWPPMRTARSESPGPWPRRCRPRRSLSRLCLLSPPACP